MPVVPVRSPVRPAPSSAPAVPPPQAAGRRHHVLLGHFDERVDRFMGADLRILYGLCAPVFAVLFALIPLFVAPSYWLAGVIVLVELVCLAFVVVKLLGMLDETPAGETPGPER